MAQIFPRYIHKMYYYLFAMSDDELDEFHINEEPCRAKLFHTMKVDFDTFGPVSKQRVLKALEYIWSSGQVEKLWGWVVPQAVDLDEVEDKPAYLCALYKKAFWPRAAAQRLRAECGVGQERRTAGR